MFPGATCYGPNMDKAKKLAKLFPLPGDQLAEIFKKAAELIDKPITAPSLCYTENGYQYKQLEPRLRSGAWDAVYDALGGGPWNYGPEYYSIQNFWDDLHRRGHPREQYAELFYCGQEPVGSENREAAKAAILQALEATKKQSSGFVRKTAASVASRSYWNNLTWWR